MSNQILAMPNNLIVVTGYGPFEGHQDVNASWEAVKLLPDILKFGDSLYNIFKQEIPVTYEDVDRIQPILWEMEPELVIHCGVHGTISQINLETQAQNGCFNKVDYNGKTLPCQRATMINNGKDRTILRTEFDVDTMVSELNGPDKVFFQSDDVGNYLCGYIYLKSLDISTRRSLFIHVPRIDRPFSSAQTSALVLEVIEKCLERLRPESPSIEI